MQRSQAEAVAHQIMVFLSAGQFDSAQRLLETTIENERRRYEEIVSTYKIPRDVPLNLLDIEPQTISALEACEIKNVGDLQGVTYEQLLEVPAVSTVRAANVRDEVRRLVRMFKTRSFVEAAE